MLDERNMAENICEVTEERSTALHRLYLGMEKRNGEVIMDASNKWSNLEYFKLTGLREYAPYMMGGGCAPRPATTAMLHDLPGNARNSLHIASFSSSLGVIKRSCLILAEPLAQLPAGGLYALDPIPA